MSWILGSFLKIIAKTKKQNKKNPHPWHVSSAPITKRPVSLLQLVFHLKKEVSDQVITNTFDTVIPSQFPLSVS